LGGGFGRAPPNSLGRTLIHASGNQMGLPKQNKLMLIYVSVKNPIWSILLTREEFSQPNIIKLVNLSHSTIPNWQKGSVISTRKVEEVFSITKNLIYKKLGDSEEACRLIDNVEKFRISYFSCNITVYESAQILDISINDCQIIVDEAIYDRLPVFSGLFYDFHSRGQDQATSDYNRYQGLYYLFVRRTYPGKPKYSAWLRCPLRVRYTIKIRDGLAIRCKLNIPKMEKDASDPINHWEYDGFLSIKIDKIFWMFEKRDSNRRDYFYFITCSGSSFDRALMMSGIYLTTGQDTEQSIAYGDILLRRIYINALQYVGVHEEFMHDNAQVVADTEKMREINDLLHRFREYKPISILPTLPNII
jgi:hypothetical protein